MSFTVTLFFFFIDYRDYVWGSPSNNGPLLKGQRQMDTYGTELWSLHVYEVPVSGTEDLREF